MAAASPSDPPSQKAVANPSYKPLPPSPNGYNSFESFYPYYLGEHSHPVTRKLHLFGTSISSLVLLRLALATIPNALALADSSPLQISSSVRSYAEVLRLNGPVWKYLTGGLVQAYFFAWVGHFFFERNKPATFKYPIYSLMGDLRMMTEVFTGKRQM